MIGFLYGQTEYNILKSSLKLDEYIAKAKEYGYLALSITDSNMYAHYKFYLKCLNSDIKPIIGLEIKVESSDNDDSFILAYALDNEGYKSLLKISSLMKINNKTFFIEELAGYKGLQFISSNNSDIKRYASLSSLAKLNELLAKYQKLDEFGIGLSYQDSQNSKASEVLLAYAREYDIKCYPLSQTLYLEEADEDVYKILRKIDNETVSIKLNNHLKAQDELQNEFFTCDEVFNNFQELVKKINLVILPVEKSLPHFENSLGLSSNEYLKSLCEKGLIRRLQSESYADFDTYKSRLDYELSVINKMGYDDYFLIVWDFVRYAKKEGVMVGPGRGSAAGSLVAYTLGITNIDPIRFDLLFERFLNPSRATMPDIDLDFPDDKREFVIDYVRNRYGSERVATITTFGTFQIKSSIRDIGKSLKIPQQDLDIITKLASTSSDFDSLLNSYSNNESVYRLLCTAKKIENLPRNTSTHAAGIIISSDELLENVPLQLGALNTLQSQLENEDLAKLGLLKIDFLGLKNLNIINNICSEIPNMNNITISSIPLDDKKTYQLMSRGDTLGVFQLESEGIKKVLTRLKPSSFNDIVAVLALYRPGPMDNIDEFIARKNGKEFNYLHESLKPILSSTYGIIVYQEQIMQIGYDFAGMSLGETDLLRRAVSKKDLSLLESNRKTFVEHALKKGRDELVANKIYDLIVRFANYGFNKSHSVAYAMISYQMAFFKANYFSIFMSRILNNVIGNTQTISSYVSYAKKRGLECISPSVNLSTKEFKSISGKLVFPFQAIYGLGISFSDEILHEREKGKFKSFDDFKSRVKGSNSKNLEALIFAGAFDEFGHSKKALVEKSDSILELYNTILDSNEVLTKEEDEYDFMHLREMELKYLGINLKYDLFRSINLLTKNHNTLFFNKKYLNRQIKVIIELRDIKVIKTKKNDEMLVGTAFDGVTELNTLAFPSNYQNIKNQVELNTLLISLGKIVFNETRERYEYQIEGLKKYEL